MKRICPHFDIATRGKHARRARRRDFEVESLEPRLLLYHGPTIPPDGSIEVALDESLDQFGFQVAMFQSYENLVSFSIFDTGASVVTVSAADQLLFDLFGSGGVPIKAPCGATADGVGGSLTGHVSEPGTVMADGLHVASLTFDTFGFPVFDIQFDPQSAAIVAGLQTFVGTLTTADDPGGCPAPASESLPTITGTPILEPATDHPAGSAALIRPQGELLDFSDFPELNGLVLPVPDLAFQNPGLGIPDDPACLRTDVDPPRDVCTDPVRIALDLVGFDNFSDPGDVPTESYNPVQSHVTVTHNGTTLGDQKFLLDTGAQLSILSTAEAEALGLDLDNPQTSVAIQGAGGAVYDVPGFTIDRLTVPLIGGSTLSFTHVPIYVLDVAPGVIDGILGMNLFNNAAAMLYEPFDPRGPSLEVNFFTEHFIDEPPLGGEQFSLLLTAMPAFAATVSGSHLPGFIHQNTAVPQLNLATPAVTNDPTPTISVMGDQWQLADGTTVAIDVDLNGNGDFTDAGERSYFTTVSVGGTAQFELTPPLAEGSYTMIARANDPLGRASTSAVQRVTIDITAPILGNMPGDQTIVAIAPGGSVANYTMPTATDAMDPSPSVQCVPVSGSVFPFGTTIVECTARDEAANVSSATFQVRVTQQTGRFEFANGVLTITGTDQNDTIQLVKSGKGFTAQTNFGNFPIPNRKTLRGVVIVAGGGNDTINLALLSSKQTSLIDAGGGDDSVTAGAGLDAVLGGAGDDQLNGLDGDNVLVGGEGADRLTGGRASDLVAGGRLDESLGPIDFFALLATWRGAKSVAAKRAAVQVLIDRVIDDVSPDSLWSGKGVDLFITGPLDWLADRRTEDFIV